MFIIDSNFYFFSIRYLKCRSHDPVANLRENLRRVRAVLVPDLDPVLLLGPLEQVPDTVLFVKKNEPWLTLRNVELKTGVI